MSALEQIKSKFGGSLEVYEKSPRRVYLSAGKSDARGIIKCLFKDLGARLSTVTGRDIPAAVELLYHLSLDSEGIVFSVKVAIEKEKLEMASVADIIPGAEWIEREIHELLGVNFTGHPNLKKLLLPEDWPEGDYPLRKKTFESEKEGTKGKLK